MASQAEVDLVISTADTLPELERDLSRIIRTAEDGAESLDIEATLAISESLSNLAEELDRVVLSAEAGADNIELQAALDAQNSLGDIQAQVEGIRQRVEQGDPIDLRAALDEVGSLSELQTQIRSVVREVEATAPDIDIEVNIDRDKSGSRSLGSLGKGLSKLLGPLGSASALLGKLAAAGGAVGPALAGVVGAVQQLAPASAIAVSGLLAVAVTAGTVKLAMAGVGDAVKAAFDPSTKPEDLDAALKGLAPSARAFVVQLQGMRKELKGVQQAAQENFFKNFDLAARLLATNVLPTLKVAIGQTASALNTMALGAAQAASDLGKDGTLGDAITSSVRGLENLITLPNLIVTGLGQIAAAAGPSFERLTAAAADAADGVSQKLTRAFESGALQSAIETAVDAVKQLGRIFGNVFEGIGNVIEGFKAQGDGLFGTLEKVSQAFADVTATRGFQDALKALSQTLSVVVSTVLPIVSQALQALGPVFQALAGPVQALVTVLGGALSKIVAALGPVLVSLSKAFGKLVTAISPIITLLGDLIAGILPVLTPLFDALGQTFEILTPFIKQVADILTAQLLPVFTTLATEVLPKVLPPLIQLGTTLIPVLTEVIGKLAPQLGKLGETFSQLLVALVPVILRVAELASKLIDGLAPVMGPILDLVVKFIELGLKIFSSTINSVVIPALDILVDLLNGDFSAAFDKAKQLIIDVSKKGAQAIQDFIRTSSQGFRDWVGQTVDRVSQLGRDVVARIKEMGNNAIEDIRGLPDRAKNALGNLGTLLTSAGADMVRGFIDGIRSKISDMVSTARGLASSAKDAVTGFLDINSPSRVMMGVGEDVVDGFRLGIAGGIPDLRKQLQGVASLAPSFALPGGQTFSIGQPAVSAPVVQVFLGNELLDQHVDTRIAESNQARDRIFVRGVRR